MTKARGSNIDVYLSTYSDVFQEAHGYLVTRSPKCTLWEKRTYPWCSQSGDIELVLLLKICFDAVLLKAYAFFRHSQVDIVPSATKDPRC